MIEVVIDFNEISFDNELLNKYKDKKYSHIPKTIKSALIIYLCNKFKDSYHITMCKLFTYLYKKLNINNMIAVNWDAFRDNIWTLRYKEWTEYREKDEWESYEEYLEEKELNSQYGVKNEQGLRDDLKLVFINFQPFFLKYRSVACQLLEILFGVIEETKKYSTDDGDDMLKMDIYIKS